MRFITALIVGLACVASFAVRAAEIDFGRYHALVIGNNEYQHLPRLETAVSDAAAVAEILRLKYGFEVTLLINATRGEILSTVNTLRAELTEKDRLLVYYAGHGELDRVTGTGYWLPVDATPNDDTNWIPNESLSRHFKGMSAHHVMVVADSCYSGALVRTANVAPRAGSERDAWLRRIVEKRARTALVSGGLEPVVDGGAGGHSVFANAFLGVLRENADVLDGQALAQSVTQKVVLNADQTPQYSDIRRAGHEGGDFLFVPKGSTVVVVPPAQSGQTDTRTLDLALWNSVKDSTRPQAFEAYLAQFPNGTFAAVARLKLEELKASAQQARAKPQTAMVAPPAPAVEVEEIDEAFIAVKNANLRSSPTTKSKKVAMLRKGAKVAVTGRVKGGNWYRIEHGGGEAYVYAPLLQGKAAWAEAKGRVEEEEKRKSESKRLAAVTLSKPSLPAQSTSTPPLHDCDKYAASPFDKHRVATGVRGKEMNVSLALRACKRAVAAFPNSARFASQYGRALAVAKNREAAVRWYRKAAEQGYADAQQNLAWMYLKGRGVAKSYAKAVHWYRKAAEQVHLVALGNLGTMYKNGYGLEKDYREALRWYRKAAEQGYAPSQYGVGVAYAKGEGVAKDYAEAIRWYRKSAAQGYARAQFAMGYMYHNGFGVAKDHVEGVRWSRIAAGQGHVGAQYNLGMAYRKGEGVAKSYAKAAHWFHLAAEKGHAHAQVNLGWMYLNGLGVKRNGEEAIRWWRKAAAQGDQTAKDQLRKLGE